MDLAYCVLGTPRHELTRQIGVMRAVGIADEHIYVDRRAASITEREGLASLMAFAQPGDRVYVLALDQLGRSLRDSIGLVHSFAERGIYLRALGGRPAKHIRASGTAAPCLLLTFRKDLGR
ncbi:recombinase family protein [Streptomyces sp. NPDC001774]